jgi:histidinol phosphatase-like PHP family hydrolase
VPRQDLNVEIATVAREEGVEWFTMGSDAHAAPERELLPLGMAIARRDPRERILNYRPLEFARSWAHRTRG